MKKSILMFLALCLASPLIAADKYVRKGATGANNGRDWNNAYNEFNQVSLAGLSGFTIYIAAGSYSTDLPTIDSINNWNLKRATVASHGPAAGWNNAYDGQVTHTGGRFLTVLNCDTVVVDGVEPRNRGCCGSWARTLTMANSRSVPLPTSRSAISKWMAPDANPTRSAGRKMDFESSTPPI
jgi:hypothetical protein